ncbi:MAG: hypothetical protein RIA69_15980 [Cyclobacteriaceae bacterium]
MKITEPWNVGQKVSECIYEYNTDSSLKKMTYYFDITRPDFVANYNYSYDNGRLSLITITYDSSTPEEEYHYLYSSNDSPYPTKITNLDGISTTISGSEGSITRITTRNGDNSTFVKIEMVNNILLGTERDIGTTLPELRKFENPGFFNPLYFEDQIFFMPQVFLPGFATYTLPYSKLLPTSVYSGDDFSGGKVYQI